MDTITETAPKEIYLGEKETRIAKHLADIDPTLVHYTKTLAKPPYKDLSDPDRLSKHFAELEPTDLVAVHLTDYFPKNGIVRPKVYTNPEFLRFSLHFTINSVAEDIEFHGFEWSWKDRKYAILIPFEKIKTRIDEYNPGDTIIIDDLELPEGTCILNDKSNNDVIPSAGKAKVIDVNFSQAGEKINGLYRAVYEQMIQMGYFPQQSNIYSGWHSGVWGLYRHIHEDFCKRNGLIMGAGHRSHWSSKMEDFSYYLERIFQDEEYKDKEQVFRYAVEEAEENFLGAEADKLYNPKIPVKYKRALAELLQQYCKKFPELEVPNLDKA